MIHYRTAAVGDHQIFYREAGDPNQTTLLSSTASRVHLTCSAI
jgi:hypothetical protein